MNLINTQCAALLLLAIASAAGCSSKDKAGDAQTNGAAGSGSEGTNPDPSGSAGGNTSLGDAVAGSAGVGTTPGDSLDGGIATTPTILIPPNGSFGVTPDGSTATCGTDVCVCNNGLDDDGDGLVDGFDSECTGAFDDDEGTFATGIPGDNRDPNWQDCFFDGNSGAGNDGCRYRTECLTGELPLTDEDCTVTEECIERCQPLTPNGCDCFGCCTIPTDGGEVDILLSDGCSVAALADETLCPRCVPTDSCNNDCGECELCLGKTMADLPASCFPPPDGSGGSGSGGSGGDVPPPPNTCSNGAEVCSEVSACPSGFFCFQGCCQVLIR